MANNGDLSHITRQIQKDTIDAQEARREADNYRLNADQKREDGGSTAYYENEADRLEQRATEVEEEKEQLQAEKERVEKRIGELEEQRRQAVSEHDSRLNQIDTELANLRGSSFML